eukprot:2772804-Pyramimonas_sp.AAC.1
MGYFTTNISLDSMVVHRERPHFNRNGPLCNQSGPLYNQNRPLYNQNGPLYNQLRAAARVWAFRKVPQSKRALRKMSKSKWALSK